MGQTRFAGQFHFSVLELLHHEHTTSRFTIRQRERIFMNTLQPQLILKRERMTPLLFRKMRFIAYKQSTLEEERRGKLHQRRKLRKSAGCGDSKMRGHFSTQIFDAASISGNVADTQLIHNPLNDCDFLLDRVDEQGVTTRLHRKRHPWKSSAGAQINIRPIRGLVYVFQPCKRIFDMQDLRTFTGYDTGEVGGLVRYKYLIKVTLDDVHFCSL